MISITNARDESQLVKIKKDLGDLHTIVFVRARCKESGLCDFKKNLV
jgi:hypothetical protein